MLVGTLAIALATAAESADDPDSEFHRVYGTTAETMPPAQFPAWVRQHVQTRTWTPGDPKAGKRLTQPVLLKSLRLGRQFLLASQKPEGHFVYEYDYVKQQSSEQENPVRQAGALWGLALLLQYEAHEPTRLALDKGLRFFRERSRPGISPGALWIDYTRDRNGTTGAVALAALAIIERLRTADAGTVPLSPEARPQLKAQLDGYLLHLKDMRLANGHFAEIYDARTKKPSRGSSPYYDGEALLCLVKAARYLGRKELVPLIETSALALAKSYTVDAWAEEADAAATKGFFQWGCMAFWEYQDTDWRHAEVLGDTLLALAWWELYVHQVLTRSANAGFAFEGLIPAHELAKARRLEVAQHDLARSIDTGLYRVTLMQVGGPLQKENPAGGRQPAADPLAVGGCLLQKTEPRLRIDVTQHQMHAAILALRYLYPSP